MIILPRHQIWHLSYNLVTPIEAHSCITKCHIFNQKAQQESSVLQECGDIKITYMSHDKIFVSIELTPNGHVTLLVVHQQFLLCKVFFHKNTHGSAGAPTRGQRQNLMYI